MRGYNVKRYIIWGLLAASFFTGCLMWYHIDRWFDEEIEIFYAGDDS